MYSQYSEEVARREMKEAIKRIVANARASHSLIPPAYHAIRLFATYHDAHFSIEDDVAGLAPWTEIEAGRFMPRRVRGSFQGRALG